MTGVQTCALPIFTKKQKKGLAFRERQSSKRKPGDATIADMDDNAVPIVEDQDLATISGDGLQIEGDSDQTKSTTSTGEIEKGSGQSEGKGKEKRKQESRLDVESKGSRKRKRENEVDVEEVKKSVVVKRKKSGDEESGEGVEKDVGSTAAQQKQRFILFVGARVFPKSVHGLIAHANLRQFKIYYLKRGHSSSLCGVRYASVDFLMALN